MADTTDATDPRPGFFAGVDLAHGGHTARLERSGGRTDLVLLGAAGEVARVTLADGDLKRLETLIARFDVMHARAGEP